MKKIILSCLILLSFNLSASEWQRYWRAGIEDWRQENFISAKDNFDLSIGLMEMENDLDHPNIYVDRSYLNLLINQYEEAVSDANKALRCENLDHQSVLTAVSTRVVALAKLGLHKEYEEDLKYLVDNMTVQIEDTDDHLIVRNLPKCKASKKSLTEFFVRSGLCESKDDVNMISSDTCIVKKDVSKILERRRENQIVSCRLWCDANAQAAIAWCVNYPVLCLVNGCNSAVFEIQTICKSCCNSGFDQELCSAPFGDILTVMQKYLQATSCGQ